MKILNFAKIRQLGDGYKKNVAFTLAEVLITLGIIGVVAAMTLPTLISNVNGVRNRTQFKKSLSTLNQAVKLNVAHYDFNFASANTTCYYQKIEPQEQVSDTTMSLCAIFNSNLAGATYLGKASEVLCDGSECYAQMYNMIKAITRDVVVYALADGSTFGFYGNNSQVCELGVGEVLDSEWINNHLRCMAFIDVNGTSLPNKKVECDTGTTSLSPETPCIVSNKKKNLGDIYPVVLHDGVVEPASNASKYISQTTK